MHDCCLIWLQNELVGIRRDIFYQGMLMMEIVVFVVFVVYTKDKEGDWPFTCGALQCHLCKVDAQNHLPCHHLPQLRQFHHLSWLKVKD